MAGRRHITIDLFDRRFVLLTAPAGRAWRKAAADTPVDSHIIQEPEWPDLYGVAPDGAVLVRPDGHVAWRSATAAGVTDFPKVLATSLALEGRPEQP